MAKGRSHAERWEAEATRLFESLKTPPPEQEEGLTRRTMDHVRAEITARDLIELSTTVLVLSVWAPVFDWIAAALGSVPHKRIES